MNSPLQNAHDAAVQQGDAPTAPAVICTVAGPRRPYSHETYAGLELQPSSARHGAYDALKLPSVFNGHRATPGATLAAQGVVDWKPPAAAPASKPVEAYTPAELGAPPARRQRKLRELTPGRDRKKAFMPRRGSVPTQLLELLTKQGGHFTYSSVAVRFGVPAGSITALFKPALTAGALVRHVVNGRACLALPGYTPPPDEPQPSRLKRELQARIDRRLQKLAQLQTEVGTLQRELARSN